MMVELVHPQAGMSVYDPCSGSGGMLILSKDYVEEHGGNPRNLHLAGQEYNGSVWSISKIWPATIREPFSMPSRVARTLMLAPGFAGLSELARMVVEGASVTVSVAAVEVAVVVPQVLVPVTMHRYFFPLSAVVVAGVV